MRLLYISLAIVVLFSGFLSADHAHWRKYKGEFYEYDLEGTAAQKIRREAIFHTKQVLIAPFKATAWTYRAGKSGFKRTKKRIEAYLTDAPGISGNQRMLKGALAEWESEMYREDNNPSRGETVNCVSATLSPSYKVLKNILYALGFRLPRATWQTVKRIVHGTCDCFQVPK